ncbi:hypothetical protein Hdeb2414_s0043g00741191 [Helianthus debilis subsp. tardiflorus]
MEVGMFTSRIESIGPLPVLGLFTNQTKPNRTARFFNQAKVERAPFDPSFSNERRASIERHITNRKVTTRLLVSKVKCSFRP